MLTQKSGLIRQRHTIRNRESNRIQVDDDALINFSSNDYFNLATHPDIKKAFIQGVETYGIGSGASALVSGYHKPHQQLEEKFAEFLNRDKAILFASGYQANVGVMTTLLGRHHTAFVDKLCHASILDGIQLSHAKSVRYRHQDLTHLAELCDAAKHPLVVTESVFSMEGDITAVDKLSKLTRDKKAFLVVDDAHGIGVLGKRGAGICEHFNLSQSDVPCLVVPMGKALAGMGGLVAGSAELIECLIQFAKTYRYTTALPPAVAVALMASLKIIEEETWRREKLKSLIGFFNNAAADRFLPLLSKDITPIRSILIGDNARVMRIKRNLQASGFFVASIRPPTVPNGKARLRISLNCDHDESAVIRLLDLIVADYENEN